jgi:hypothetical protein
MQRVKRAAMIVKPKQPYLDWANSLGGDGVQIGDDFMPEHTVYLVEDVTDVQWNVEAIIAPHVAAIFEEELGDWHGEEHDWPVHRDWALFQAWFDVEIHSMVLDLGRGRLKTERYEQV